MAIDGESWEDNKESMGTNKYISVIKSDVFYLWNEWGDREKNIKGVFLKVSRFGIEIDCFQILMNVYDLFIFLYEKFNQLETLRNALRL
jgi:hypothetical protein